MALLRRVRMTAARLIHGFGRSADVQEGYARLIVRERSEDGRPDEWSMIRASSFVLAAVYRALVGDELAPLGLFREAANEYLELGGPFYVALAIRTNHTELIYDHVRRLSDRDVESDTLPTDPETLLFDLLVATSMVAIQGSDGFAFRAMIRMLDQGDTFGMLPVDRLGLPLRLYLSIGRGVGEAVSGEDSELATLREALVEYLRRTDEIIVKAMNDRIHWNRSRSGVLPEEPETLATCVTVNAAASRRFTDRRVDDLTADAVLTTDRQSVPREQVNFYRHIALVEATVEVVAWTGLPYCLSSAW